MRCFVEISRNMRHFSHYIHFQILEARVNLVSKQIGLLLDVPPANRELTEHLFADIKKGIDTHKHLSYC